MSFRVKINIINKNDITFFFQSDYLIFMFSWIIFYYTINIINLRNSILNCDAIVVSRLVMIQVLDLWKNILVLE